MRSSKQAHRGAILFWLILDLGIVAFVGVQYLGWPGSSQETDDGEQLGQFAEDRRQEGDLSVGDLAPDFTLKTFDGKSTVTLSSFRDKRPVVLVFGSYTCPTFRNQVGALYNMRDRYKREAEFLVVYIEEAHPLGGRQMQENVYWGINVAQPKTLEERAQVAAACAAKLRLQAPFLVDTIDNKTQTDYSAWPIRLYVVGEDGRVAYKGKPGPIRFSIGEMMEALNKELQAETALRHPSRLAGDLQATLTPATSRCDIAGERDVLALHRRPAPSEATSPPRT